MSPMADPEPTHEWIQDPLGRLRLIERAICELSGKPIPYADSHAEFCDLEPEGTGLYRTENHTTTIWYGQVLGVYT